jgi:hypothetical protein
MADASKKKRMGTLWVLFLLAGGISVSAGEKDKQSEAKKKPDPNHLVLKMKPNTWLSVPNTHMRAVGADPKKYPKIQGNAGIQGIMCKWSGGAFDTNRNRLIVWGGGHNGYGGNEVYVFDVPTLKWIRLNEPYGDASNDTGNGYGPAVTKVGTPPARHTYNALAYIAHADRFFAKAGCQYSKRGGGTNRSWTLDLKKLKWQDMTTKSDEDIGGLGTCCSYDPFSRKVWYGCSKGFHSYAFDTNTWKTLWYRSGQETRFYYYTSLFDTKRKCFVAVGTDVKKSKASLKVVDVSKEKISLDIWQTKGDPNPLDKKIANAGFDYDSHNDRYVLFTENEVVSVLNPETKTWKTFKVKGAMKRLKRGTGLFGRWRYVPDYRAFVTVNHVDDNVYFYKMPEAKDLKPAKTDSK